MHHKGIRVLGGLGVFGLTLAFAISMAAQAATSGSFAVGTLRHTFKPPGATADGFGNAVAQSGSTVVIGEYAIDSAAGEAHIYVKGTSGWPTKPAATLADPAATSVDYFGYSVAVSGNIAVVGAYGTNSGAGAAYIYVKGASGWPTTPTATLADPAAGSSAGDAFGYSVAVSGSTVIVGAWGTNSGAGAAYVYVEGSSGWPTTPTATLAGPVGQSDFGWSVAVSGNTAVIGDPGNPEAAYVYVKGTSGWRTTPRATLAEPAASLFGFSVSISGSTVVVGAHDTSGGGAAYIFVKGSSGWPTSPTATLADPAAAPSDAFGVSVAVSGSTVVVGAYGTNASAGAAYIYVKGTSGWPTTPTATLDPPPSTGPADFGYSVASSGTTAVVGAEGTDSGAGAAYLYSA